MTANKKQFKTVRLGDVCRVVSGATPRRNRSEFWGKGINWVTPKDLSNLNGTTLYETPEQITEKGLASCSTEVLPVGSVLFSSRAPIGLIALTGAEMCTNQGFKSLIPFEGADGKFLYWCVRFVTPQIKAQGRGATFKEISKNQMEAFEIPYIDDFHEQKRIAKILDLADEARRKRRENLKLTDELIRSLFLQTFGDPVSNPMGWQTRSLTKHGSFKNGLNYGRGESGVRLRYLGVGEFGQRSEITDIQSLPRVNLNMPPSAEFYLRDGDLVFVRSNGNKQLVGRCVAVYPGDEKVCFSGFCIRYRIETESLLPRYLAQLFRSGTFRDKLLEGGRGANIQNINQKILAALEVPMPPIQLQKKFEDQAKQITTQKAREKELHKQHDDLFNALLQRAFTGGL